MKTGRKEAHRVENSKSRVLLLPQIWNKSIEIEYLRWMLSNIHHVVFQQVVFGLGLASIPALLHLYNNMTAS
jgi:hypothetical protein